ncbi:MAG: response regulator [Flaviaesturariibacter sp.]|nr:response regulator [Flaviaesturariibacter sp.]
MKTLAPAAELPVTSALRSFPTIVLADDDPDDRLLFEEAFNSLCLPATLVQLDDGDQVMNYLDRSPLPDLLFLDINMPRKSGLQCLAAIKADPRLASVPVLILSTSSNESTIERTIKGGAKSYCIKPCTFQQLIDIIRNAIEKILPAPLSTA